MQQVCSKYVAYVYVYDVDTPLVPCPCLCHDMQLCLHLCMQQVCSICMYMYMMWLLLWSLVPASVMICSCVYICVCSKYVAYVKHMIMQQVSHICRYIVCSKYATYVYRMLQVCNICISYAASM